MTELPSSPETTTTQPQPRRRIAANVIFSILQKAQGAVFSYITLRLVLSAMTVEEYGFYTVLFIAVMQNLTQLLQLGIPNLLTRFVPDYFTQAKFRSIHTLFRTVNWLQIALWSFLILVVFIFAEKLVPLLHFPGSANDMRIFSIGAFAYLVQENYRTVLSGLFRQTVIFWVILIYNSLRFLAILFVTQYMYSLVAVVSAEVIVFVLGLIFYVIAYRRTITMLMKQEQPAVSPSNGSALSAILH